MLIKYNDIEAYCNEMHAIANNMKDIMDAIESEYIKLISSGAWVGPASDFYKKRLKELTATFDEAYNEIEMSILFLANASDGYKAIDQKIMTEICNNLKITEPNISSSTVFNK